jgi:hypothetical protein
MGSFLLNCFVSNQIIPEDSPCVVFPIIKVKGYTHTKLSRRNKDFVSRSEFDSICYANSFWELSGLKIDVIAQDYGRQVLVDSVFNRMSILIFFHYLLEHSYKAEAGENTSHDLEFDFEAICKEFGPQIYQVIQPSYFEVPKQMEPLPWAEFQTVWEKLQELISENRVYVAGVNKSEPTQLQLAICSKDSYDYLVQEYSQNEVRTKLDEMVINFEEELAFYRQHHKNNDGTIASEFLKLNDGLPISSRYRSYTWDLIAKIDWSKTQFTVKTFSELCAAHQPVLEFLQFQSGLNELSIKLGPLYGGSQDYENDGGKKYAKLVTYVCKKTNAFIKKYKI